MADMKTLTVGDVTYNLVDDDAARKNLSDVENTNFKDKAIASGVMGNLTVTTSGTGATYTATVPGITELAVGVGFVMIPHTVSTTTTPTINVNGLGAKGIRRRMSGIYTSLQTGYANSWLAANKPFRLMYDGTYWVVEGVDKPSTADLYGSITAEKTTYDNSTTGMSAENVQTAINELFTSVSDGKAVVASAITDKGVEVSSDATFAGLAEAISAITAGGGGGGSPSVSVTSKDVNFIDYDGTLLYSYTVAEAQALTELPPLPSHDGLICQGWNYDLATIKEYNRDVTVGAMYITDDGKTRIYIHLEEGRTAPVLGCCPKGTVTVDWGDGSTPDTLTGTSVSTAVWTNNHQYASAGDYVITLTVDGTMGFYGENASNASPGILRFSSSDVARNTVYQNSIAKVEIGNGVTGIMQGAFQNCYSLTSISIPNSVTGIGNYAFQNCYSLTSISIPNSVTIIGNYVFSYCYSLANISISDSLTTVGTYVFQNCYSLASISISDSVTVIRGYVFQNCYSLASISISDSVTSIGSYVFRNCYSLASISIPAGVTSIGSYVFGGCNGVAFYNFTQHTTVPSLSNTNAFTGIPADCEIRVPASLVDEWKAATNWSTYASQIVGV